ncbi:MAG TPA: hypothetical protein VMT03_06965 [Polyangia bacterium]|nr:hypothetical protein [Polyangia bacterium]
MICLATLLRPPSVDGGEAITRLAVESGATGVHLAADCHLELLAGAPLLATALRLGLEIPSLALPLPERPLAGGKRLPRLGAPATDERAAAIGLAEQALGIAAAFGLRALEIDFGPVFLTATPAEFARHFARRACAPGEPGAAVLERALAERRALAPSVLDACRWSLERLARGAERAGARLAIRVGATPWQAPTPRELGELRDMFGEIAAPAWDPGRLSVLATLGLPVSDARLKALAADATLAVENDAVGLIPGYLPGLGERADALSGIAPPPSAPRVVAGAPDSTDIEVMAAVRR